MKFSRAYMRGKQFLAVQMSFSFSFGKRLIKSVKKGFVWIRPDGKQKHCPTISALVRIVRDYDGSYLISLLKQAYRLRGDKRSLLKLAAL